MRGQEGVAAPDWQETGAASCLPNNSRPRESSRESKKKHRSQRGSWAREEQKRTGINHQLRGRNQKNDKKSKKKDKEKKKHISRLYQWVQHAPPNETFTGPAHQWRQGFSNVLSKLEFQTWDFRPYSLRRGGATYLFSAPSNSDQLMASRCWQSGKTARVYLNDGLAVLAEMTLAWNSFSRNCRQHSTPVVSPYPCRHLSPCQRRHRSGEVRRGRASARKMCKKRKDCVEWVWFLLSWVWPDEGKPIVEDTLNSYGCLSWILFRLCWEAPGASGKFPIQEMCEGNNFRAPLCGKAFRTFA